MQIDMENRLVNSLEPVLLDGEWQVASSCGEFQALNPATGEQLERRFPVSDWSDCDRALDAAVKAAEALREAEPEILASFLEAYALGMEQESHELAELAAMETGLPFQPRLKDVELPRTVNQLRQAAQAAREGSWALPTLDTKANIRSYFAPIGPVVTIGPNNFPFAFNGASGGDFAAAIAAGNPVIVKAHPAHPRTTQRLVELAFAALRQTQLPPATIQLLYRLGHADGERLVSDPRVAATGFTGGRGTGMQLKAAADRAGKLIYLEMSSVNPVVVLPAALAERSAAIAEEFGTSCLMGAGQFCTNPGFVLLVEGPATESFISAVQSKFRATPPGTLLGPAVRSGLIESTSKLIAAGAQVLAGGEAAAGPRIAFDNTLLRISGAQFLAQAQLFQTEMFGASALFVIAQNMAQTVDILRHLEGNLTGTIYTASAGESERDYQLVAAALRPRVGRLLNNKMPTGVAVSPAMNHGGPYPSTGHPGFTAVGIPASIRRFAMLQCFDNVPQERLPRLLKDVMPGSAWRLVDGQWTRGNIERSES